MTLTADPIAGAARVVVLSRAAPAVRGSLAEFLHFGYSIVVRDDAIAALAEIVHDPSSILVVPCDIPFPLLGDVLDLAVATTGSAVLLGLNPVADAGVIGRALAAGVQGTVHLPLTAERLAQAMRIVSFASTESDDAVTVAGALAISPRRYEARWHGRPVDTSPREFAVLLTLARAYPNMVTLDELAEEYGAVSDPHASVRIIINKLRNRIGAVAGHDDMVIETIRGIGYRLKA